MHDATVQEILDQRPAHEPGREEEQRRAPRVRRLIVDERYRQDDYRCAEESAVEHVSQLVMLDGGQSVHAVVPVLSAGSPFDLAGWEFVPASGEGYRNDLNSCTPRLCFW